MENQSASPVMISSMETFCGSKLWVSQFYICKCYLERICELETIKKILGNKGHPSIHRYIYFVLNFAFKIFG